MGISGWPIKLYWWKQFPGLIWPQTVSLLTCVVPRMCSISHFELWKFLKHIWPQTFQTKGCNLEVPIVRSALCGKLLYKELGLSSSQCLAGLPKYFLVTCCNAQWQQRWFQLPSATQVCGAGAEHLLRVKFHRMTCMWFFRERRRVNAPFERVRH